ncbi:acyltransferase family protein [Streptomyces olivaceiscleroticus]|uniref:Acyltransferase family protein n=1 Tax=Streptomyces olivaceiscleroticus TaxID=68245 RepID=A0ABP3L6S6_9ACTN
MGQRAPEVPGTGRDPFFDNAKLLAMVLVVAGHAWQPLKDSHAVWSAYLFLYMFHMPLFIVISGYFSRSFVLKPEQGKRLLTGVALPYLVFETAYTLYGNVVDGRHNDLSLLSPWYLTWFLAALFVWRLTAPVWRAMHPYLAVGLAFAVALIGAATSVSGILNLDRVLQFLPFFVIGLVLRPEHWQLLRARWVRIASVPVLVAGAAFAYWAKGRMTAQWAMHNHSWGELHVSWPIGVAMVLGTTLCSLVLSAAFLALVPRRRTWFTSLGAGTLCAYLLHGFFVRTAAWKGWFDAAFWHTPAGELAVTVFGVALALILTSAPVRRFFRPVMEPRMDWAFRMPLARRQAPARPAEEASTPAATAGSRTTGG